MVLLFHPVPKGDVNTGMWMKLCEVTSSAVSRTDSKANSFIRELGLSWCLSTPSLCRWSTQHLLLKFVTLAYRQEKARLVMELKDSSNEMMKNMQASVVAEGRKIKKTAAPGSGGQDQDGKEAAGMLDNMRGCCQLGNRLGKLLRIIKGPT